MLIIDREPPITAFDRYDLSLIGSICNLKIKILFYTAEPKNKKKKVNGSEFNKARYNRKIIKHEDIDMLTANNIDTFQIYKH